MNNDEAKFILSAYRLGGQDASDPRFQEALEQLKHDPELAKWFAEQRAFDQSVRRQLLTATPVPPDLRATLLAARNIVRPAPAWHRFAWITAAAACFAVLLISVFVWNGEEKQHASLFDRLASTSQLNAAHVTVMSDDLTKIQQWLKAQSAVARFDLPRGLQDWAPMGCRIVDWNGMKVSMICFHGGAEKHVDLFVGNLPPGMTISRTPEATIVNGQVLISWQSGRQFYALTGMDHDSLSILL